MKIIQSKLNEEFVLPESTFIFDIETTGLSHKYAKVVMISYIYLEDGITMLEQNYIDNLNDEKQLLFRFLEIVKKYNFAVHFNGYSFDIPFINKRLESNKIAFNYNKKLSVDMYRKIKNSGTLKQSEKLSGFHREDDISGAEFVNLYKYYLKNKDKKIMDKLLLHNRDDVISTPFLANENSHIIRERIVEIEDKNYFISETILSKNNLRIILENTIEKRYIDTKVVELSGVVFFDVGKIFDQLSNRDKNNLIVKLNEKLFISNISTYISSNKCSIEICDYYCSI